MENIEQKTKKCPYCGSEIPVEARKCRYCGEWVDGSHDDSNEEQNSQPSARIPLSDPVPSSFLEAILRCVRDKFLIYEGRASRKEFWYFYVVSLVSCLVAIGLLCASIQLTGVDHVQGGNVIATILMLIATLLSVGFGLPFLAVATRRLHDTGKSGWHWLWGLVPCIGSLILLYLWALPSDGDNKYGTDPVFNSAPESQKKYEPSKRDLFITIVLGGFGLLFGFVMAMSFWHSYEPAPKEDAESNYEQPAPKDNQVAESDTAGPETETANASSGQEESSSSEEEESSSSDDVSWIDPGYYEGEMDGYPMAIDLTMENESDYSGTYKNLNAGTKMKLTGYGEGNELFLEGEVAGSTYRFNLTQVRQGELKGLCTVNEKRAKSVRLRLQK